MLYVKKPQSFEAAQFDGKNLLPGMLFDTSGAYFKNIFCEHVYVPAGHWIVKDSVGIELIYSDEDFKRYFQTI